MIARLQQALESLYGVERRKGKLDLDGTRALLRAIGDPQDRFRSVHVAGTNGKGSVCALVERALREAGHRTGLFTSPHLVDFRERIRVAGRWADAARLERRLEHIHGLPEGRDRTFFEVCTALAFDDFAARGVEIAVVEVGLGGRLDCTNVLAPMVTAITSIGLDHVEILGDTVEEIAAEKAGIVKPGVPVVLADDDRFARAVIERIARERGAPVVDPAREAWPGLAAHPELMGDHQRLNLRIALQTLAVLRDLGLDLPERAVERGVALARWPGRLEACPGQPRLWWDGAHNPQAVERLAAAWLGRHRYPPRAMVLALSLDKDLGAIFDVLGRRFAGVRIVATRSRSERAAEPEAIVTAARARGLEAETMPDVATAARRALEAAGTGPVLLTGSLFAVGEAMEAFGGAPGEML